MADGDENNGPDVSADDIQPDTGGGLADAMQSGMASAAPTAAPAGPSAPPVGAEVHQRHGGLITGLLGVLLDGLSAGVRTPQGPEGFSQSADMAAKMPQQRQQQMQAASTAAMQNKVQLAQMHVQMQQIKHLASTLNDEDLESLTSSQKALVAQAVKDDGMTLLAETPSREAAIGKVGEMHAQNPGDALNYLPLIARHDKDGNPVWGVYQLRGKNTLGEDKDFVVSGSKELGIDDDSVHATAGMPWDNVMKLYTQKTRDIQAKIEAARAVKVQGMKGDTAETVANTKATAQVAAASKKASTPKPVKAGDMAIGTLNGRQVAGTIEELTAAGATGATKAGAAEAEKIQNAHSLINVFDSNDPNDLGLNQIAENLDKKGKLGPAAATFAEWLNKGKTVANFNAGDPEVQQLFTKMGLATTGLMQVHVGARGSAQMLEHFEELAKAKEMSPKAFRAALDTETKYVRMKAMRPDDVKQRYGRDMKTAERNAASGDPFAKFGGKKR